MSLRTVALSSALAFLAMVASNNTIAQNQPATSTLGAPGTVWGGAHLMLEVTAEGATLDFDCASGTIAKPVSVDAQGKFRAKGSFTREGPGPVTREGNPAAAAIYSGSIEGQTMHLRVASGPQHENVGEYVLVRGQPGRVMKCR